MLSRWSVSAHLILAVTVIVTAGQWGEEEPWVQLLGFVRAPRSVPYPGVCRGLMDSSTRMFWKYCKLSMIKTEVPSRFPAGGDKDWWGCLVGTGRNRFKIDSICGPHLLFLTSVYRCVCPDQCWALVMSQRPSQGDVLCRSGAGDNLEPAFPCVAGVAETDRIPREHVRGGRSCWSASQERSSGGSYLDWNFQHLSRSPVEQVHWKSPSLKRARCFRRTFFYQSGNCTHLKIISYPCLVPVPIYTFLLKPIFSL